MIVPANVVICLLEILSYETWLTITRFPCSATIRQDLADNLVNLGFIYLHDGRYGITPTGEQFLNNMQQNNIIN